LVLHGHMHQPGIARVTRPLEVNNPSAGAHSFTVVAMGSTGVAQAHLGETPQNTFGVLDFVDGVPTVAVHTVHHTNPTSMLWQTKLPLGT
jgi:hypothetical protein